MCCKPNVCLPAELHQEPPERCEEVRVALLGVLSQIMTAHPQVVLALVAVSSREGCQLITVTRVWAWLGLQLCLTGYHTKRLLHIATSIHTFLLLQSGRI